MGEHTWIVDQKTGALVVEGMDAKQASFLVGDLLGESTEFGCAKPLELRHVERQNVRRSPIDGELIQISGYYHDSLVEGPGRRSVVRMQGCSIHCPGCWVKDTWDPAGGYTAKTTDVAAALMDPTFERDGVTILGGEPFQQPMALSYLISLLRQHHLCDHITVYTGYTYAKLLNQFARYGWLHWILQHIDLLIDGPYSAVRAGSAGPWTGSGNQKLIDLRTTRKEGVLKEWRG